MKHIYIIGNGFDIFTGLKTSYSDFRKWLERHYVFVYENMTSAYEMSGEWWHDFEKQLGNLDVRKYVQKYTPPEKSIEEILEEIEKQREFENKYNLPPSMIPETPCAERLRGLLDVLQYCFEQWVDYSQRRITAPNYINIEKNDSYFINFNYTDVLECIYKIPEERVLHIHGRASKHEHLIFGHGKRLNADVILSHDEQETCDELNRYPKIRN